MSGDAMVHYVAVFDWCDGTNDQEIWWPCCDRAELAEDMEDIKDFGLRPIGIWRVTPKIRGEEMGR